MRSIPRCLACQAATLLDGGGDELAAACTCERVPAPPAPLPSREAVVRFRLRRAREAAEAAAECLRNAAREVCPLRGGGDLYQAAEDLSRKADELAGILALRSGDPNGLELDRPVNERDRERLQKGQHK